MIKKQFVKSRNVCKVTFELPADTDADEVQLITDANDWRPISFDRQKNGKWKLVHEFEPGREHQFRYRLLKSSMEQYLNDEEADRVVANEQGTENAVISC